MSKQFHRLLADLDRHLAGTVRPALARIPTSHHKKYHALFCAIQASVELETINVLPDEKQRLRHEIAERMAELI